MTNDSKPSGDLQSIRAWLAKNLDAERFAFIDEFLLVAQQESERLRVLVGRQAAEITLNGGGIFSPSDEAIAKALAAQVADLHNIVVETKAKATALAAENARLHASIRAHPEVALTLAMDTVKYIEVDAGVRYWEDAKLNGKDDVDGKMPLRSDKRWRPTIDLDSGQILHWPQGTTADIHYKVCDDGKYWLLDSQQQRVAEWRDDYVPNDILCVGDEGYGDYIILKVNADGLIVGWAKPSFSVGWQPVRGQQTKNSNAATP